MQTDRSFVGMTRLADENRSGAATVILSEAKDLYAAAPLWYPPLQNVIPKRSEGSLTARPGGQGFFNTGWQLHIRCNPSVQLPTVQLKIFLRPGDELLYIGYTNGLESGMLDSPQESTDYIFQFATNILCPGTPTVEYEGQVYNTIQIFSQCLLKENLNVGEMIPGTMEQSNNGTIEKYCYNNEPDSCDKYGGLYQWWEMMQYTIQPGTQGICPPGWHLPTDEEWKVLEGAVDSQYGIGDLEWDLQWEYHGYDAGMNLKTTSGWYENGNGTDLFGFSGLPGGYSDSDIFTSVSKQNYWWTSMEYDDMRAWLHGLSYHDPGVERAFGQGYFGYEEYGFSARCLRDY